MGVGMLRRYHADVPEHANEPGDVEAAEEAQEVTETPTEQDGDGSPEQVEPPAGNASAEEWRTYAVEAHGADPEQVADMGRNELREKYGPQPE